MAALGRREVAVREGQTSRLDTDLAYTVREHNVRRLDCLSHLSATLCTPTYAQERSESRGPCDTQSPSADYLLTAS